MAYEQQSRGQRYEQHPATESPELPPLPASSPSISSLPPTPAAYSTNGLPSNPRLGALETKQQPRSRILSNQSSNSHFDDRASSTSQATPQPSQQYSNTDSIAQGGPASVPAKKKMNPLSDLIRTEGLYVEDLSVIVKRVAAAWSRANFPPPELDTAFRAVEAVYRINKNLLKRLNEIGPTPASPKALGDLLMSWVPEIETSYLRYCDTFHTSFDTFPPVQSNDKLHTTLASLEWPATLPSPTPEQSERVTLDLLFQLPFERIRYYKKLFSKLLRSTQEGKSDYELLIGANETLDMLLGRSQNALGRVVGGGNDGRSSSASQRVKNSSVPVPRESFDTMSGASGSDRFSTTSSAATSTTILSGVPRIEDLERRLCTDRALDIFTMLPKKCKLHIAAPNLTFTRTLRRAADVKLSFYPLSDPNRREVVIARPYIFLLTDLFLVCSRMSPEERTAMKGSDGEGPDMWLLYPPLAGKHLRVADGKVEGELEVTVMRKEKLVVRTESHQAAMEWKAAFEDAIAFGTSQGLRVKTDSSTINVARDTPNSASTIQSAFPLPSAVSTRDNDRPFPTMQDLNGPLPSPGYDERGALDRSRGYDGPPSDGSDPRYQSQYEMAPPPPPRQNLYTEQIYSSNPSSTTSLGPRSTAASPSFHVSKASEGYAQPSLNTNGFDPNRYGPGTAQSPSTLDSSNGPYTPPTSAFANDQQYYQQAFPPPIPSYDFDNTNSYRSTVGSFASGGSGGSSGYPDPPPVPMNHARQQFNSQYPSRAPSSLRTDSGDDEQRLSPGRHQEFFRSRSAEGFANGNGHNSSHDNYSRGPPLAKLNIDQPYSAGGQRSARTSSAPGSTYGDFRNDFTSSHQPLNLFDSGALDSPPFSPLAAVVKDTTTIVASMRCKVFLQQHHASWKSLGTAKLKLFLSSPSNIKQLVVESDKSDKKVFVSTIVLTDGVEKVGKTGVAIELSDTGARTGIIYMLQMKTEQSAMGLFDQLLLGSDRGAARHSFSH